MNLDERIEQHLHRLDIDRCEILEAIRRATDSTVRRWQFKRLARVTRTIHALGECLTKEVKV